MARVQSQIDRQRIRAKLRSKLEQEKVKLKSSLNTELCNQKVRGMERERETCNGNGKIGNGGREGDRREEARETGKGEGE